jgi:putative transposase
MIDALVETGHRVKLCCRLLRVSSRRLLQVHEATAVANADASAMADRTDPRGPYGVPADLWFPAGARLAHPWHGGSGQRATRSSTKEQPTIAGLPGPAKVRRLHGVATADELVHRKFHRLSPKELCVTDITEHPTREGKVYSCAVMDTFSRKIVGWPIDNAQDSNLVVNALDMAMKNRQPSSGGIVHADHGVQFTSWAFTNKIRNLRG